PTRVRPGQAARRRRLELSAGRRSHRASPSPPRRAPGPAPIARAPRPATAVYYRTACWTDRGPWREQARARPSRPMHSGVESGETVVPDPHAGLSDEALVARYRALAAEQHCAEREEIVALLYERHRQWVGAEAWRRLGSAFGPLYWQDVLQETFLTTWRRMHDGEEPVYSFRGLLADGLRKRVADRLDQLCQGARLARAQARGTGPTAPPGAVRIIPLEGLAAEDRSRLETLADP